jgi:hypothetical protein
MKFRKLRIAWSVGIILPYVMYPAVYISCNPLPRWRAVEAYFLLALPTLFFALLPWLNWRFSLRAMLIVTTLIAVTLGLAVWVARQ